jgi:GNAT superfamily N-acetyltransferase
VEVRFATAADAHAIERIRVDGWRRAYRHVFPPADLDAMPVDESRWVERLVEPPGGWAILVATRADEGVGFAALGPSRDAERAGELYAIYVDPDAWSTGAGRALLRRAEELLAVTYDEATLWVLEHNPRARRFYEAFGWGADGGRQMFERFGVRAPELRYRKKLAPASDTDSSSSRS